MTIRNKLLARLPQEQYRTLFGRLKTIQLKAGDNLYEPKTEIEYAYFPNSGTLSAVCVLSAGNMIEVATIGNEGAVGVMSFLDKQTSPHRVFCQVPGEALRIAIRDLREAALREDSLRMLLVNYQAAFMFQVSQSVACNGSHIVEERCCRWLLMTLDRVDGDVIELTHEFLSAMLGVRRSSVTETLQVLKQRELIDYGRGKIQVLDRDRLEDGSCECYRAVRDEYKRLLGE
jgi:CRP-like cAMP-binding protein